MAPLERRNFEEYDVESQRSLNSSFGVGMACDVKPEPVPAHFSSMKHRVHTSYSSGEVDLLLDESALEEIKTVSETTKESLLGDLESLAARSETLKLLFGAAGVYATYLFHGYVSEDLFRYRAADGTGFSYVWYLQVLESAVTIVVGYLGRKCFGCARGKLPVKPFLKSGASQLLAKALMSLSLSAGLSFPVVVLAKSGKIVPVMLGQLILSHDNSYGARDYSFAVMIVAGTALLSLGTSTQKGQEQSDSWMGLILIMASLFMDGCTGGLQKNLKKETASMQPTAFDFLFFSHIAMCSFSFLIALAMGDLWRGHAFLSENPAILFWVLASCICSTIGQCFIFYVIATFDPVVCTTITTTRKMASVLLSVTFKGHRLSQMGCGGLVIALAALCIEVEGKISKQRRQTAEKAAAQETENEKEVL
jgi:UDP-galactose transporter B1